LTDWNFETEHVLSWLVAFIIAAIGLVLFLGYVLGWAILWITHLFWGMEWPGFFTALTLGVVIIIAVICIKAVSQSDG
jgi:hypothetical protein